MKRVLLILVFYFLQAPYFAGIRGETGERNFTDEKPTLVAGYSKKIFFNVNINDARASAKVLTETLVKKENVFGKSDTVIFNDLPSIEKALRAKGVDIIIMRPEEFLALKDKSSLEPVFVSDFGKYFYGDFILLVRADSQVRQLSELQQRRLIIEISQSGSIPAFWLESLLMKGALGELKGFFSSIKEVDKASDAVLPVFFKQADASVVTRSAFDLMVELNPQVGKELKPLAVSPPFVTGIVCFRRSMQDGQKTYLSNYLRNFHTHPEGKQLITLFRVNRLVPFNPSYLETVEALLKEHQGLKVRLTKKR